MSEKNCSVVVESVVESSSPAGVAVSGAVSTLGEQGAGRSSRSSRSQGVSITCYSQL